MSILFWLVVFTGTALALAYTRCSLRTSTYAMGAFLILYTAFGGLGWGIKLLYWLVFAGFALVLNITHFRRQLFSAPLLGFFRSVLPVMSATERTAYEAGSVWWEGDLFSGRPDWNRLLSFPTPRLTYEEQAFLDGPVETVNRLCDEWQITFHDMDITPRTWQFLKEKRFFGMTIPKAYGGLDLSAFARSQVLEKIGGGPGGSTLGSIVAAPNSLGPAELLLHYGTQKQKDYYLPRLAKGDEIPCFGFSSSCTGSKAGAIADKGVVCKGHWEGRQVLGMTLTWDKRYITLAPVATLLGLTFKLYDPDHVLGEQEAVGITCALVPAQTPGVEIGRRHFTLDNPFMNGPTQGKDVFVPLDFIIGGQEMAGRGWRMLMECLSVRSISASSMSMGAAKAGAGATGAYARIRRQFDGAIGGFEGIQKTLARMGGRTYAGDAVRRFTASALDLGERPSVPSAIAKCQCTEISRQVATDAMDIHGDKGICLGPNNYLGRGWEGAPIATSGEAGNILSCSIAIFRQAAIRAHPFILREMDAVHDSNPQRGLETFDQLLFDHLGHVCTAAARSLVMGLTDSRFVIVPTDVPTRAYYQKLSRYSANLALLADMTLGTLGGVAKCGECLSARLGEVLSRLYLASATLKRFEDEGRRMADRPLLDWALQDTFHGVEEALDGVLHHLPNRPVAWLARTLIFPAGRRARPPHDSAEHAVAGLMQQPGGARRRLCAAGQAAERTDGLLDRALRQVIDTEGLRNRVRDAYTDGPLREPHPRERIGEAVQADVINHEEGNKLREVFDLVRQALQVDDFTHEELVRKAGASHSGANKKSAPGTRAGEGGGKKKRETEAA